MYKKSERDKERAREIKKEQRKREERGNKGRTFYPNKKISILFFLYIAS